MQSYFCLREIPVSFPTFLWAEVKIPIGWNLGWQVCLKIWPTTFHSTLCLSVQFLLPALKLCPTTFHSFLCLLGQFLEWLNRNRCDGLWTEQPQIPVQCDRLSRWDVGHVRNVYSLWRTLHGRGLWSWLGSAFRGRSGMYYEEANQRCDDMISNKIL